jgi:CheY-like chemotaxis protein
MSYKELPEGNTPRGHKRHHQPLHRRHREWSRELLRVEEQCNALRQELLTLVPAVTIVCGPNSELMRLVGRALYGPTSDHTHKLKEFRLAKFALDQLSEQTRERIRTILRQMSGLPGHEEDGACQLRLLASPRTILVIADDPSLSRTVSRTLRSYGFHVERSDAMDVVREKLESSTPALVIMDLLTSDGDNIALTQDLLSRQIRVILLCGIGVVSTTPGLAFLQRQFDDQILLTTVINVLGELP